MNLKYLVAKLHVFELKISVAECEDITLISNGKILFNFSLPNSALFLNSIIRNFDFTHGWTANPKAVGYFFT